MLCDTVYVQHYVMLVTLSSKTVKFNTKFSIAFECCILLTFECLAGLLMSVFLQM